MPKSEKPTGFRFRVALPSQFPRFQTLADKATNANVRWLTTEPASLSRLCLPRFLERNAPKDNLSTVIHNHYSHPERVLFQYLSLSAK